MVNHLNALTKLSQRLGKVIVPDVTSGFFLFLFSRLSQQEGLLFLDKNKTLWQPTLVLMKLLSAK